MLGEAPDLQLPPLAQAALAMFDEPPESRPLLSTATSRRVYTAVDRSTLRRPKEAPRPDSWRFDSWQPGRTVSSDTGIAPLRNHLSSTWGASSPHRNTGSVPGTGRRQFSRTTSVPADVRLAPRGGLPKATYGNNDSAEVVSSTNRFGSRGTFKAVPLPTINQHRPSAKSLRRVGTQRYLSGTVSASELTTQMTAAGVDLSDVTASSSADDKRFRTGDIDLPVRHAERQGELIASRYRKQEFTHAPHRLLMPYAMQGLPMRLMRKNEMEQEELLALERLSLQAAPELYAGRGIETQAEPKRLRDLKLEKRRRENQIAVVPEEATPEDEPEEASATPDLQPEGEPVEAVPGPDDVAAGQEPFVGGWGGTVLEADAAQAGATQDQHLRQTRRRSSAAFVSLMSRRASAADVQGYQHQHLGQSHGRHGGVAEQEDNGADGETAPEAMGNELLGLIHVRLQCGSGGNARSCGADRAPRLQHAPTTPFLVKRF